MSHTNFALKTIKDMVSEQENFLHPRIYQDFQHVTNDPYFYRPSPLLRVNQKFRAPTSANTSDLLAVLVWLPARQNQSRFLPVSTTKHWLWKRPKSKNKHPQLEHFLQRQLQDSTHSYFPRRKTLFQTTKSAQMIPARMSPSISLTRRMKITAMRHLTRAFSLSAHDHLRRSYTYHFFQKWIRLDIQSHHML